MLSDAGIFTVLVLTAVIWPCELVVILSTTVNEPPYPGDKFDVVLDLVTLSCEILILDAPVWLAVKVPEPPSTPVPVIVNVPLPIVGVLVKLL